MTATAAQSAQAGRTLIRKTGIRKIWDSQNWDSRNLEHRAGIEPAYTGFADLRVSHFATGA
jgi:hypothetical protein